MHQKIEYKNEYLERMQKMLGDDYPAFFEAINSDRTWGLRFNRIKVNDDKLCKLKGAFDFGLREIPWEKSGYYYDDATAPGKHFLHDLGAYYIQEPSAQSVVPRMNIEPGDVILDMCAAPGGKTTQILSYLNNKGLLISNEYVQKRALVLASNVERMGARNSIVLNEEPTHMATMLPGIFDKILIDSPCSGEGMFRKNPDAIEEWSVENVDICAGRDDMILDAAAAMLKPGGEITYSTCTFEYAENEGAIERFLERHTDFSLLMQERLYPHLVEGEGHFMARLHRDGICTKTVGTKRSSKNKVYPELKDFVKMFIENDELLTGCIEEYKGNLFLINDLSPALTGLHIIRPGLSLGELKKGRFEPSHTLGMSLGVDDVKNYVNLTEADIEKYLRGESVNNDAALQGWSLICYDGISAGWGKASGNTIKNHYPKGLRRK